MLTVLIETLNSEKPLANTLSAMVPAVVEGLVRRVVVIDRGSLDETELVATGAGCTFSNDARLQAAFDAIRTDWVLLLLPGALVQDGWEEMVRRHMDSANKPARFSLPRENGLGRFFAGRSSGKAGLLVRFEVVKPALLEGVPFDGLSRQLKPIRLRHTICPPVDRP